MISKTAVLLTSSLLATIAMAGESAEFCTAGGYYSGAQNRFLSGLATHILQTRGELGSPGCNALWKSAFEVGERFSKTGQSSKADAQILDQAGAFSTRAYSAVSKSMGF